MRFLLGLCFILCLTSAQVQAQGFAGLGQSATGFALPDPERPPNFPADQGSHPKFRIEWWYVTANLTGPDGAAYGVQWTLFRNALRPGGDDDDQVWMAHAAVATPRGHLYAERFARGGTGQANVTAEPFEAYIDEWRMAGETLNTITVSAQSDVFHYDLRLTTEAPFVMQGQNGYSVKSQEGQASHYYSQPFYQVQGTLTLPDGQTPVTGQAWLDREWSSQPLAATQTGWDWISLHFETGEKLMGFQLRDTKGANYTTGTWIAGDGTPEPLAEGDIEFAPQGHTEIEGRRVPTRWLITIPKRNFETTVSAIYPNSWMGTTIPYWEGPVNVSGTHRGVGFLEMSGY